MITLEIFQQEVDEMISSGMSCMDAVMAWAEKHGFEPEVGADLVNKSPLLITRLRMEAESLKLLKE